MEWIRFLLLIRQDFQDYSGLFFLLRFPDETAKTQSASGGTLLIYLW